MFTMTVFKQRHILALMQLVGVHSSKFKDLYLCIPVIQNTVYRCNTCSRKLCVVYDNACCLFLMTIHFIFNFHTAYSRK